MIETANTKEIGLMADTMKLIGFYVAGLALMWGLAYTASTVVKDYEVIEPEDGVRCVVVSRMMNTGVSCWKLNDE